MILQMLAEGKITAEEADALLDALGTKTPPAPPHAAQRENIPEGIAGGLAGFAGRVATWGADFGAKISEEIRDGRVPILRWIGDCFDGHESVTEKSGKFDCDEVEIECSCEAGSYILKGVEEDGYRLNIKQRFGNADGPVIKEEGGRLLIKGSGIVRGELYLPQNLKYRIKLKSSAGRLEAENLTITGGDINTEAGSIRLDRLVTGSLSAKSSAGSVEGTAITARDLRLESDCGRIHLELAPTTGGHCSLKTDVGSLSLVVPFRSDLGYRLRAQADVGSIWCSPEFSVEEENKTVGHRRLKAETPGYRDRENQVELELETDCGSIRVSGNA